MASPTSLKESPGSISSLHQDVEIGAALVIGGCGFLGHHVVKTLLAESTCTSIAVMSRSPFKNRFPGVSYYIGDVSNVDHVESVVGQVKPRVIVNCASPHAYVDHEHSYQYFTVNVDGNKNLLASASRVGTVFAYVYTSSGPIIAGSGGGYDHADETHPTLAWPTIRKGDPYHLAKALGDKMVLEANEKHGFRTACIRPTALYGEGDEQMIVPVMGVLEDGMSHIWMGYNDNDMDSVYVGHVAEAHVLAIKGLLAEIDNPIAPKIGGEAFNITDDEPYPPWTFFRKMWSIAGDKTPLDSVWMIPNAIVMFMAHIAEWFVWAFSFGKKRPSMLKIERMEFLLLTRTYDITKIRQRLGFVPWANQPYSGVEEAIRGSVNWFTKPENHGPIKLPSSASSLPEHPFHLISKTGAKSYPGLPLGHHCVENARFMAQTHNTFFRALNSIYQQCIDILPGTQDAADMLAYCVIVYDFIHQHQLHEEALYFPEIERVTGNKGMMEVNLHQHQSIEAGLEEFRNYAEKTSRHDYSGSKLRNIIDSFAETLESHNHDEIRTILDLHDKIDSATLKKIDETMRKAAEKDSDMFKSGPLVLGCQDKFFTIDDETHPFPLVPFAVKVIVDLVLSRRHKEVWRFNPSDMYGRPRGLSCGPEKVSVVPASGKVTRKEKKLDVKATTAGGVSKLIPVFAALVGFWSILTFFSI